MKYLPFLKGKYSTAPGLLLMHQAELPADKLVFQMDELYSHYIQNKKNCRTENIHKYYVQTKLLPVIAITVKKFLVIQMVKEHPDFIIFNHTKEEYQLRNQQTGETIEWKNDWLMTNNSYLNLFDALCCQVQEDIAVCQLSG